MLSKIVNFLKTALGNDLLLPIVLFITYITFLIIARGVVPTTTELIADFQLLYAKYGYEIIFVSALLESLVLVNLFIPGGGALALGAVFARTGQTELEWVILAGAGGATLGYTLDFVLGYFGFADVIKKMGYGNFLDQAKLRLRQFGNKGLILGFIHPNIASFLALVAGTLKLNWPNFILVSILATFFWGTLWALLIYALGDIFLIFIKKYSFLLILIMIVGFLLTRLWRNKSNVRS